LPRFAGYFKSLFSRQVLSALVNEAMALAEIWALITASKWRGAPQLNDGDG
jgi:hypothetical protein